MTLRHYVSTRLRRMGTITTLSTVMAFTLVACGSPDTTVQPTVTIVSPSATETATIELPAEVPTAVGAATGGTVTIPDAVATGTAAAVELTVGSMTPTSSSTSATATATPTPASQGGQTDGAAAEVEGTLREWAIDLSQAEVPAGTIRFVVTNEGQFTHNLAITDSSGELAATPGFTAADGAQLLEIDLEPGTYTLICNLPGHAARGQKTELVVK